VFQGLEVSDTEGRADGFRIMIGFQVDLLSHFQVFALKTLNLNP
jgi:hypothetical protein